VRTGVLILQGFHILLNRSTTVENTSLDVRHVLAETVVFVANLVCQLTSVAHNHDGNLAIDRLDLLEGCEYEDCSLTETGLGLADDIATEEGLGNASLLDCRPSGR
jgi:hypothetical protein